MSSAHCLQPAARPFVDWVGGEAALPGGAGQIEAFHERIGRVAACDPGRIAIDDGQVQFTYAELVSRARAVAEIVAAEVPRGGAVAILMPPSAMVVPVLLGCLAAGRTSLVLDFHHPRARNAAILRSAGAVAVLVADASAADWVCGPGIRLVVVGEGARPVQGDCTMAWIGPDETALVVLFTSGSTGLPKGIVNTWRSVLHRAELHVAACDLRPADEVLLLSSPGTIAGVRDILAALSVGAGLHLTDPRRAGLRELRMLLREQRITVLYTVPALIRSLVGVDEGTEDFASLRAVRLGGDRVFWSDVTLLRGVLGRDAVIYVGYGSTEAVAMHWIVPAEMVPEGATVPVGYPVPGVEWAIVEEDGFATPNGAVGELLLRGSDVALGLWEAGRCVPSYNLSSSDEAGRRVLVTGDMARLRPDGLFEIAGRRDRQVKIMGQRVEPAELEAVLLGVAGVADAAVIARRVGGRSSLVAFVAANQTETEGVVAAVRARVRAALPSSLQPARIHLLGSIPRLPGAKVDVVALEACDDEHRAG